ncbi:MAG: (Fe-S)-binding protein [Candidatus Thorarchaeota archaeon]
MGGEIKIVITEKQDWKGIIHRCFRCGYCKFTHDFSDFNCPSYKKFRFETYSTGGRLWLIYGILNNEIAWSESIANAIYACTTCGNCTENCRFDKFNDFLVDFIEEARTEAAQSGFCPENQKFILERIENPENFNPFGESNSDNQELKKIYDLPDKAEWIYFIGCTSNYRQQQLRDATLRFLKKVEINFTLIDEHCCSSPLIRTGQKSIIPDLMNFNIDQLNDAGALKVICSCAGCYRTLKKDYEKLGADLGIEVYHTSELIKNLLDEGKIKFTSNFDKVVTYHDPCHLGRHMGLYEAPRDIIKSIPEIKFVEMKRNRSNAWCCGAGGGVKIGYPDWALEISKERLDEAKETDAAVLTSMCPFCKTNLKDANEKYHMGFEIIDLIELIDQLQIELNK